MNYNEFLHTKIEVAPVSGFEIPKTEMNPLMFEWQKDIVYWAIKKGRAALMKKNMVQYTKEILTQEIHGTQRIKIPYDPQVEMCIPQWLRSA